MNGVLRVFGRLHGVRLPEHSGTLLQPAPPALSGMRSHVVRDWSRVRQLMPEWNHLLAQSRADCIFLTSQWIDAWARVVGRHYVPFVIVVRDKGGSLCGLAPLYVQPFSLLGVLRWRLLRVMADRLTGAEYPDWIVRSGCEREAALCIWEALAESHDQWDCLWMPQMSGWTGARERIAGTCEEMGFYVNARPLEFSEIALPDSVPAYERVLTESRLRKFRWQKNKILRRGNVSITRCSSLAELPRYLDALMELHTARRSVLGDQGTFVSRPEEARFYREFAPLALEAGWLSLWGLQEDTRFKAVQLGYVYNNTYYSLQEGFDPAYIPGAGNMLRFAIIRHCIESGIRHYDFLGGYSEHKQRWGAKLRLGQDLFIGRPGLANRMVFLGKVWPTGRYLRPLAVAGGPLSPP